MVYTGKTWDGDPTTSVYFPVTGWARWDLALYCKWMHQDIALNVQNVLDRKYILSGQTATLLIPGDPRKLTLSDTIHF